MSGAPFTIPTRYTLRGRPWRVVRATEAEVKKRHPIAKKHGSFYGYAHAPSTTLYLCHDRCETQEVLCATFCHELSHTIFWAMGFEEDKPSEKKVENLALALYEFFKTAKGEIKL